MEHTYDLSNIINFNPIYKKKITTPKENGATYTVVSVDLPFEVDERKEEQPAYPVGFNPEENLYRSVILNEDETRLLSFSLTKSVPFSHFKEHFKEVDEVGEVGEDESSRGVEWSSRFLITEIVEGTMINLWWDNERDKWQISTKKSVSGNYTYFKNPFINKQKTFKEMFIEAVGDFESPEFGGSLSKKHFYSFVLRHPNNHIVYNVKEAEVYLVAVYEKTGDWQVKFVPQPEFEKWGILPDAKLRYPIIYGSPSQTITNYNDILAIIEEDNKQITDKINEIVAKLASGCGNTAEYCPYLTSYMMGVMIIDMETGIRTKIENKVYQYLKDLRGNHPSYKYKYYELVLTNRLNEFIYYFPQYTDLFMKLEDEFNTYVKSIYWYYVNKYILKNPSISEKGKIPYRISHHINYLHYGVYIPSVKLGEKKSITLNMVYGYIWSMPIKSILYWMNYDSIMAKKNVNNEA